jgi:hypothetical protein
MLVPAETAVTSPALVTVATLVDADTHGVEAAFVPEPVNCMVDPTQTFNVPVMEGKAFIVTVEVMLQPLLLV